MQSEESLDHIQGCLTEIIPSQCLEQALECSEAWVEFRRRRLQYYKRVVTTRIWYELFITGLNFLAINLQAVVS